MTPFHAFFASLTLAVGLLWSLAVAGATAQAVLNVPVTGAPVALGSLGVLCEAVPEPFASQQRGRLVVPPRDPAGVGAVARVRIAPTEAGCEDSDKVVQVVATGAWPTVVPASISLAPDEGRLTLEGTNLQGAQLLWRKGERDWLDACHQPTATAGGERCEWTVRDRTSTDPADNRFALLPHAAQIGPQARFFDAAGVRVRLDAVTAQPAQVVIDRLVPQEASVDLSAGQGSLELMHPEAVGTVACSPLPCELQESALLVRGTTRPASSVTATLRMRPHVVLRDGDKTTSEITAELYVTTCPMEIVSGEPFRNAEASAVVLKLEGVCANEVASLRFAHQQDPLIVARTVHHDDGTYVLLRVGELKDEWLTITAYRNQKVAIAVARSVTRSVPPIRAALEVPGFPNVDFIPTNRWARVHAVATGSDAHAVAVPVEGIYDVRYEGTRSYVRGDRNASGMTPLQFAFRNTSLPGPLGEVDLARTPDLLLRGIREANIPAPLHAGKGGPKPLIEVLCGGDAQADPTRLPVGQTVNMPFSLRDTCRVVFHRQRLEEKYGAQRIRLEIDVYDVDGRPRGDARVSETLTLRPGSRARTAYVHGVTSHFDRLAVRVRHEADEAHYLGASEIRTGAPAAKWTAIFGAARARLYATTAFPTGLYRLSSRDESGLLSLNFGLLSRLTWLDDEGTEGFLGLEAGLVVIGLGNAVTSSGDELTQAGAVVGLGLSVPFANRSTSAQASINVHAWLEVDLTRDEASGEDGRFAFIFGPSISIGNLGTNL